MNEKEKKKVNSTENWKEDKMFQMIFGLLGGLALFIYGMQCMADGLQRLTGDKLKKIFGAITNIPVLGVAIGAGVTAVVQSSSLTTVMAVGFVNASLMTLKQAIAIIMGANIGTTITAQLVAFEITQYWAVPLALGFFIYFFIKRKKVKNTAYIFFALGILLLGMITMSNSVAPLRESPMFYDAIVFFSQYQILALLAGMIFTAIVQSSAATIGLLIAMASTGLVPLEAALPILLGTNIGTCITAVFASIGTSTAAKRVAVAHVLFNVIGAVLFMLILPLFTKLVLAVSPDSVARQIANAHTLFNVIVTVLMTPFIGKYAKLIEKIVPTKAPGPSKNVKYLDWRFLDSPDFALDLALKEVLYMADLARENLRWSIEALLDKDPEKIEKVEEQEEVVDELEKDICRYLSQISQSGLSETLSVLHTGLLHAANDVERISDHATNIIEQANIMIGENLSYSEVAENGLREMYRLADQAYGYALVALSDHDMRAADLSYEAEQQVDDMEHDLRSEHMARLIAGQCNPSSGVLFLDVISNLERVSDHAANIADVAKGNL